MPDPAQYQCPRCGEGIPNNVMLGKYPGALSRWDNATEVCSSCGQDEAMRTLPIIGMKGPLDRSDWWDVTGVRP